VRLGSRTIAASIAVFFAAQSVLAWGVGAQRFISGKAIETLPPEIRGFYENSATQIRSLVAGPTQSIESDPNEARYHVLYLDRYSPFPFDVLPRSYKAALAKFGRAKLDSNGRLPWQVGVYSAKLTTAFRGKDWDHVRQFSALLANFVAETHDPFNMSDPKDLRTGTSPGLQGRFSTSLVERYSMFFPMRPNDAYFVNDPTDSAFENCLASHSWLEVIENADRRSRAGLADYTDEYYDRFYNAIGAVLIRQLSEASTEVGAFWLTSWVNAGKPSLPQ
jgi:hypothetical protein